MNISVYMGVKHKFENEWALVSFSQIIYKKGGLKQTTPTSSYLTLSQVFEENELNYLLCSYLPQC